MQNKQKGMQRDRERSPCHNTVEGKTRSSCNNTRKGFVSFKYLSVLFFQASKLPNMSATDLNKYIADINKTMEFSGNLELSLTDFSKNFDLQRHIKLLLNSALGKFNQKDIQIRSRFLRTTEDFEKIFSTENERIVDVNDISDNICHVNVQSNYPSKNRRTNPAILAFVTANARLFLHKKILLLKEKQFQPYYCDTDSILFAGKKEVSIPLKFSLAFGDFKHDLGECAKIQEFRAYGRKNFSLKYEKEGETKTLTKVCGMSLNSKIVQEEIKSIEMSETQKPQISQFRKVYDKNIRSREPILQKVAYNKSDFRCQRKLCDSNDVLTKPWGF